MNEIEKKLIEFKADYQNTNSEFLEEYGWMDLRKRIEMGNRLPSRNFGARFLYLSAIAFVVILFSGFVKAVSASLPGQPLYSAKRLGESIVLAVTDNKEKQIEIRADEIIGISKQKDESHKQMDLAIEEYQKSVEKVKKEAEKSSEKKEEIKKAIKEQEKKFKEVIEENEKKSEEMKRKMEKMEEKILNKDMDSDFINEEENNKNAEIEVEIKSED